VLLALVPVVVWMSRRAATGFGRGRSRLALAVRIVVVVLVVLALAEIELVRKNEDLCVIFALDVSDSVPREKVAEAVDFVNEQVKLAGPDDLAGVVVFGRDSEIEASPTTSLKLNEPQSIIEGETTNIAAAVRLATASFPTGYNRRLVVVTDGNENQGAALEDAAHAAANRVQVDVRPVQFRYTDEFLVDKVVVPEHVAENEPFAVKVAVKSQSPARARLSLYQNDRLMAASDIQLRAGLNVFTQNTLLAKPGFYTYEARLEKLDGADDTITANNAATAYTIVEGPPTVLCVGLAAEETSYLCEALRAEEITVVECGVHELPATLSELRAYDAIILSNVPAEAFPPGELKLIEKYVDILGGGLVVTGGHESFSAGAYAATPLERVLPVQSDLKKRMILPSGALALIMHTCEIPDANYWAEQIAISAIKALSRRDKVGLVYYGGMGGGTNWLFPIQPAGDRGKLIRLVRAMLPGDMPDFATPMEMALAGLNKTRASLKHMVIISDGDPQAPSQGLLDRIVEAGITVSTVGINPHSPRDVDILNTVASAGNGRFYNVQDPRKLPAIFIREARRVSRPPVREGDFKPQLVHSSEPMVGIQPDDVPMLKGYVVTEPKPLAELPIISEKKEPILAHWRYGLGKVAAFTSDVTNRWAARWIEWDGFGKFWSQTVRWAMRSVEKGRFHVATSLQGDELAITVDAFNKDIDYLSTLGMKATVVTPDMEARSVTLEPTGPGRFEGHLPAVSAGTYFAGINYSEGSDSSGVLYTGLTVPYSQEYRYLKTNGVLLERLAGAAGGRIVASVEYNAFSRDLPPTSSAQPIWPLILTLAACLFLVDVAVRKIAIDFRKAAARTWAFARRVLWPFGAREAQPVVETHISRLQRIRQQVAGRMTEPAPEVAEVLQTEEAPGVPTPVRRVETPTPIARAATAGQTQPAGETPPQPSESHIDRLLKAKRAARRNFESSESTEGEEQPGD